MWLKETYSSNKGNLCKMEEGILRELSCTKLFIKFVILSDRYSKARVSSIDEYRHKW